VVTSIVVAAQALAATETDVRRGESLSVPTPQRAWPCQLIVAKDLRAFAELAWDGSATFREQCRRLAAAGAVVIVHSASSRETWRAETRIGVTVEGVTFARVRLRRTAGAVEFLAHELEHVLERVEGVKFLMESSRGNSRVSLTGGAFETQRAIDAGRRVAMEVREAARMHTAVNARR
jgi:hypothetical protein